MKQINPDILAFTLTLVYYTIFGLIIYIAKKYPSPKVETLTTFIIILMMTGTFFLIRSVFKD